MCGFCVFFNVFLVFDVCLKCCVFFCCGRVFYNVFCMFHKSLVLFLCVVYVVCGCFAIRACAFVVCVLFVLCVLLVTVTIDKRHADVNKTIV